MAGVTLRDNGMKALLKRLGEGSKSITVGVHSDAGAESNGTSIAAVAAYQEFGTATIPSRSFVRAWADEKAGDIRDALRKIGAGVLQGRYTAAQGLAQAGVLFVGQIQKRISDGIPPPLADSTVKRKGSSTPLIDTGVLRSSVAFKVSK